MITDEKTAIKIFEAIGLTDEEAKIYMILVKLKSALLTDIARELGVNRTTLYPYIETLLKLNLVRKTIKGKRIYYTPESPQQIKNLKKIKDRKFDDALPKLEAAFSSVSAPGKVITFENKSSIKELCEIMIKNASFLHIIHNPKDTTKILGKDGFNAILESIRKQKIKLRELWPQGEEYLEHHADHFVKNLPKHEHIESAILINADTVAFISYKSESGVLIKDKSIANTFKILFENLWINS